MADLVLIVDDDEAVQTMLFKVIRSNGLQAQIASSGEMALEMTRKTEYDLILLYAARNCSICSRNVSCCICPM